MQPLKRTQHPIIDLHSTNSKDTFDVTVRLGNYLVTYEAEIKGFGPLDQDKTNIIQQFTKAALTALSQKLTKDDPHLEHLTFDRLEADGIHGHFSNPTQSKSQTFVLGYTELETLPQLIDHQPLAKQLASQMETAKKTSAVAGQHLSDPIWDTMVSYTPNQGSTKPYQDEKPKLPQQQELSDSDKSGRFNKTTKKRELSEEPEQQKTPAALFKEFDEQIEIFQKVLSPQGEMNQKALKTEEKQKLIQALQALSLEFEKAKEATKDADLMFEMESKHYAVDQALHLLAEKKEKVAMKEPYEALFGIIELLAPPAKRKEISEAYDNYLKACLLGRKEEKTIISNRRILTKLLPENSILRDCLVESGLIYQLERDGSLTGDGYKELMKKKQGIYQRLLPIGIAFHPSALTPTCSESVMWVFSQIPSDEKHAKDFLLVAEYCEQFSREFMKNEKAQTMDNGNRLYTLLQKKLAQKIPSNAGLRQYVLKNATSLVQQILNPQSEETEQEVPEDVAEALALCKKAQTEFLQAQQEIEALQQAHEKDSKKKAGATLEIPEELKLRHQRAAQKFHLASQELSRLNEEWIAKQPQKQPPASSSSSASASSTSKPKPVESTQKAFKNAGEWIQHIKVQVRQLQRVQPREKQNAINLLTYFQKDLERYYSAEKSQQEQILQQVNSAMEQGLTVRNNVFHFEEPEDEQGTNKCPQAIKNLISAQLLSLQKSDEEDE